jgi:hypothetical protein
MYNIFMSGNAFEAGAEKFSSSPRQEAGIGKFLMAALLAIVAGAAVGAVAPENPFGHETHGR